MDIKVNARASSVQFISVQIRYNKVNSKYCRSEFGIGRFISVLFGESNMAWGQSISIMDIIITENYNYTDLITFLFSIVSIRCKNVINLTKSKLLMRQLFRSGEVQKIRTNNGTSIDLRALHTEDCSNIFKYNEYSRYSVRANRKIENQSNKTS